MYKIPSAIVEFSELDAKPLTRVADPITVLGLYSPLVDKATNLWCQHHSYHRDQMGCDKRDQAVKFLGLWNPLFLISSYALNQNNEMKCYVIISIHETTTAILSHCCLLLPNGKALPSLLILYNAELVPLENITIC